MPSWKSIESWRAPSRRVGWHAAERWRESFGAVVKARGQRLEQCLKEWDTELRDIGEDPSRENWAHFRPLRLSREEDWSDWLAHLLRSSSSGHFPARLLGRGAGEAERWQVKRVERERPADSCRADIVLHFQAGDWAHVEVKIGDQDFAKTADTATALEKRYHSARCRGHYLLLPTEDVHSWEDERVRLKLREGWIATLTWRDVAKALRASVREPKDEDLRWRVWAVTFLGAVEQLQLGFPHVGKSDIADENYRPQQVDDERVRFLRAIGKEQS